MRFGAKILFKNVTLQFNPGYRYGLIGANGCGKSTLIKILTGEVTAESGQFTLPQQTKLGALSQDHYAYQGSTVLEIVLRGKTKLWEALERKKALLAQESFTEQACEALDRLEKIIEEQGGYAAEAEGAKLLEGLGIRAEWHHRPIDLLSGGYKLRVLLAQVLFAEPDLLVLDEPTNHLDLYSIKWLEDYLRNFQGTVLVTSHDRDFLNGICTHIADVDYGTIKIYKGNYEAFQIQKQADREQKEHLLQKQERRRTELKGFIDRFRAKASKARQAQSKERLVVQLEEEIEALDLTPSSRIYPQLSFEPLRASGIKVLELQSICKAYGPKKVLHQVSFEIERGERVAIIGPNGSGKSTLLEILTEHQQADHGHFTWGFATRLAYFPQDHAREVQGNSSLLDWLGKFDSDMSQEKLRDLLGRVLFSGDTVHQSIQTLSGGEKARLLLARVMLQKPNVLIFDEPTNHLDMEAIEELVRALECFEGTLLLVSHNRYFVSRLAQRIIEISYEGVKDFKGTYAEFVEKQEKDHLSSQVVLSQRYTQDSSSSQPLSSHSYLDQKRLRNQKAQLKKIVSQKEEECHELELKIAEMEARLAAEGFYQEALREEQQRVIDQKHALDAQLMRAMEQWEKASLDLQLCEEPSS
jgi:ATPase subunit of ABC transporter with duplicated ATPase domains